MSITITEITHFSSGVRKLTVKAREEAVAVETRLIAQLQAGGATLEEARHVAQSCRLAEFSTHFESNAAGKTVLIRMTKEEFGRVKKMLGMESVEVK
jgi:hypothetical protein